MSGTRYLVLQPLLILQLFGTIMAFYDFSWLLSYRKL